MTIPLLSKPSPHAPPGFGAAPARQPHVITSDEEALDLIRGLAASFRLGAVRRDRARLPAHGEIESLTNAGFFGMTAPKKFGGAGVSARTLAEAFRILSAADASIGQMSQNHFCWLPAAANDSAEQAGYFFSRFLAGDRISYVQPHNGGPDPSDPEPAIRRTWGGWRISGRRLLPFEAAPAQWLAFTARFNPADRRSAFVFFIDAAVKGVMRAGGRDGSAALMFDDVFVPDCNVFPLLPVRAGGRSFQLNASLIHSAIALGIAEGALSDASAYICDLDLQQTATGEGAEQPFVVTEFAKCSAMVRNAGVLLNDAAGAVDQALQWPSNGTVLNARLAVAEARLLCTEAANRISEEFLLLADVSATLGRYGFDRHRRNACRHALIDPMQWWEYHLGNDYLNGGMQPENPYI